MPEDTLSHRSSLSAVILAGGLGRRMGGQDKGLIPLQGRPLITHVIDALKNQVGEIFINSENPAYSEFGYPLIADALPGKLGPLAGLLGALETGTTPFILSVPVDVPCLPEDLVQRMTDTLAQSDAEICSVWDGQRTHPVISITPRRLAPELRRFMEQGGRRVEDWVRGRRHVLADFSDKPESFVNVNTPQDLQGVEQKGM